MKEIPPYNPLDKRHLGESVAEALLAQDVYSLPLKDQFTGAGLYAIYYSGDFLPYRFIKDGNTNKKFTSPIYVGKAVPAGARKGGYGLGENPGLVLFKRINEHAESIKQTKNLKIDDFSCRYLVVEDIWIPLGESLLIETFHPLWNKVLDGFGNHDPGSGRHQQRRSPWDALHEGRSWADNLKACDRSSKELISEIEAFQKQVNLLRSKDEKNS